MWLPIWLCCDTNKLQGSKVDTLPSGCFPYHATSHSLTTCTPCARYQRGSEVCQKLAESLAHLTGAEERELFDFGRRAGEAAPLMLILDRRDDPVTPLLSQWTYQVETRYLESARQSC
jgi:Sec1 family